MNTFTEADQSYRAVIEAVGQQLPAAFQEANAISKVDLNGSDVTYAVLLRLKSFFITQEHIKKELNKVYAAPAADFFVETVCFFLKIVLGKIDDSLIVASEKSITPKRGSIRPDISIWKDGKVLVAIECKTQLGWNRDNWREDFNVRQTQLISQCCDAKLFLLVMTGSNWGGFGADARVGKQFFVLLDDIWPVAFDIVGSSNKIVHTIEMLLNEILSHING